MYETGQPPHFRAHALGDPRIRPKDLEVETIRPGDQRQAFAFTDKGDFLESTTAIPEPHEFQLRVSLKGETTELTFTEQAHGHDRGGPGHSGGPGHGGEHGHGGHGHGGGHGHSHGTVDPTIFTSERGLWATKWSFVALLVTASAQLVVVLMSHSVALAADMIHNFGDATTALPLAIAFILGKRLPSKRFTYGLGRVEDLAGFMVVLTILASAVVAAYVAIDRLRHPQPVTNVGAIMIASVIGFLGNEGVAVFRIKIGKKINSAALIADGYHARTDGWTSLAVLVGAVGVHLGYPIADPIVGLVITVAILGVVWQSARVVFTRMLDGIEPEIVEQIRSVASRVSGVVGVGAIRARWLGHRIHAEVTVDVPPALTVAQAHELADAVEHELTTQNPVISGASVHVHPAP